MDGTVDIDVVSQLQIISLFFFYAGLFYYAHFLFSYIYVWILVLQIGILLIWYIMMNPLY